MARTGQYQEGQRAVCLSDDDDIKQPLKDELRLTDLAWHPAERACQLLHCQARHYEI